MRRIFWDDLFNDIYFLVKRWREIHFSCGRFLFVRKKTTVVWNGKSIRSLNKNTRDYIVGPAKERRKRADICEQILALDPLSSLTGNEVYGSLVTPEPNYLSANQTDRCKYLRAFDVNREMVSLEHVLPLHSKQ